MARIFFEGILVGYGFRLMAACLKTDFAVHVASFIVAIQTCFERDFLYHAAIVKNATKHLSGARDAHILAAHENPADESSRRTHSFSGAVKSLPHVALSDVQALGKDEE